MSISTLSNYDTTYLVLGAITVAGCCLTKAYEQANKKYPGAPELYLIDLRQKITHVVHGIPSRFLEDTFNKCTRGAP